MRLSRPDENDPTKQRHFEISIDSPFHILSCRATTANTSLPAYTTGGVPVTPDDEFDCGCPGAAIRRRNTPPVHAPATNASTTTVNSIPAVPARNWTNNTAGLTAPTPAHVHEPSSGVQDPNSGAPRPMHLLRNPSFNPPPFNEEEPPPPLMTPPPNYENIVNGDSRHALADYFARLADELGDEDEQGDRGRVDVPLTPGGRINRSMDASRTWMPLGAPAAH
jgi:arrestin-related trafficking adapter 3/6